ncbi:membrane protein [Clostridium botulinum C/D str. BKT12695]|nr:membrane protein [Clostridium botulinum C/D str. BKT12695]
MLNELKKFTSKLHIKILILLVILASITTAHSAINSNSFSALKSADSKMIEGKASIPLIKEQYKNTKGILTIDKLNKALKYYKSKPAGDRAYLETDIKYPCVFNLMEKAYIYDDAPESSMFQKESAIFHKLKNMNDFYTRNTKVIKKKLNNEKNNYESWEKNIILEKAKNINKPFIIDFNKHWELVYSCFMLCFMVIAISAIVIGSRLFSYEKDKNMDILLVSLGDESLRKIGINKIKALIIFLTVELLISVSIISVIMFSNAGISAWNSQIQIKYFTSIYNLTFGQAYLLIIFTGWVSIIAIGMFTATLNAYKQKSYTTLFLGVIMTFIPMLAVRLDMFPVIITKFFKMQPINAFSIIGNLESLQVFNFVFFKVLTMTAIIVNAMIILGICIFISPRLFIAKIKNA